MDAAATLAIQERFAEKTKWPVVGLQFAGTAALCGILTQFFGLWVGLLPALFLALALLGEALFVTLGLISVLAYAFLGDSYGLRIDSSERAFGAGFQIAEQMVALTTSPVLLAIPMFTLAGAIMTASMAPDRNPTRERDRSLVPSLRTRLPVLPPIQKGKRE